MFPMTPIAAALALFFCAGALAAPSAVGTTPRSLMAQAKGLPSEFEEHFFDVPLAVRVELDQQFLGEAMIVLSRDDRITLLEFTDVADSQIPANERDTWGAYLQQGVPLGACAGSCPEQMLAVHYSLENSLVSIATEHAERDTQTPRFYDQPRGGSTGLIVRNQVNLNGGQEQDLGGRYGLEASASLGNWTQSFNMQLARMSMSVQLGSPLWLVIDAQRVRQVLINLLSNAIKFTEEGQVRVEAELTVDLLVPTTGRLRVVVSDTGVGISRRQQLRLFQAFSQVDESVTRKFGGTGLGLTICASLLKLMGGSIRLESQFGRGTQVEVLLSAPLAAPLKNPLHDGRTTALSTVRQRALSVLVVEDHPENQFVIKRQLQALGHGVTQAETGALGLSLHARSRFDIILLDCNLPDIDGYEFAACVRRRELESQERVPIIAISALVGPEHMNVCFEAGMDGVLAKPLRIEQLGQIIDLWCDVQPLAMIDADEPPGVEVDLQQTFFATSSIDLEYMLQALGASDWLQVSRLAHRISGAAMMLGATDVVAAAREVEYLVSEAGGPEGIAAAIERLRATVDCSSCFETGPANRCY